MDETARKAARRASLGHHNSTAAPVDLDNDGFMIFEDGGAFSICPTACSSVKPVFHSKGTHLSSTPSNVALSANDYWAFVNGDSDSHGNFTKFTAVRPSSMRFKKANNANSASAALESKGIELNIHPGATNSSCVDNPILSAGTDGRGKKGTDKGSGRGRLSETAAESRERGRKSDVHAVQAPSDLGDLYPG